VTAALEGWLARGASYHGELSFDGPVRIEGHMVGIVRSKGLVEVGEHGHVDGAIYAAQALVAGRVEGYLRATERATLLETAVVAAKVETPWLDVRLGCQWKGDAVVTRR
jgi:cytoskeletal protein CcmA (bactofilin family)